MAASVVFVHGGTTAARDEVPCRHGALLRMALLRQPGWYAAAEAAERAVFRRRSYSLTPLAAGEGWTVVLVERPGDPSLPDFPVRRELHRRAAARRGRVLTVVTDVAGARQVWGWERRLPLEQVVYAEELPPRVAPGTAPGIFMPEAELRIALDATALAMEGAEAARAALIHRLGRTFPAVRSLAAEPDRRPGERLQRFVESSDEAEVVRRVWGELENLRVLDPACGSGAWLEGCLEALRAIGAACLQRMQGWITDGLEGGSRRISRRGADFRRLLARSAELAHGGERDRFVMETILLRCIHGVDADASVATVCRSGLAARLGVHPCDAATWVDVRVGILPGELGQGRERAAIGRGDVRTAPLSGVIEDTSDALGRAEEQLIRMRLRQGSSEADLAEGRAEIARRRERLSRLAFAAGRCTARGSPLHPRIEYPWIARGRGFDLIRGVDPRWAGAQGR